MFSFIIKKSLQALLVILCVVSVVYVFQNHSIIDPVEDFMISSFGDRSYDSELFQKAYEKEARRQNKHLPGFYISITPSYFPDNINEIVSHEDRLFKKNLLRYSRCSECVDQFLYAKQALSKYPKEKQTDQEASVQTLLSRIKREKDLRKLDILISKLQEKSKRASFIEADVELIIKRWKALDRSLHTSLLPRIKWNGTQNQYHKYLMRIFSCKMGISKTDGRTAKQKIINALKWTLSINITGFILAGFFGLFLGLWSIKYDGSTLEKSVTSVLFILYTMPVFWTATLMVVFFTTDEYGTWTNLFPSVGIKYWYSDQSVSEQIILNIRQLMLPVICITLPSLALVSRIMKSKFSEVLSLGFVTALKAKGLSENRILGMHVLRNGLIPYITIMTGSIPSLFAGSLVIEIIFNIPGIGKLLFDSILSTDWPVIGSLVIILSMVTVLAYLIADILYSWANPKIKLEGS